MRTIDADELKENFKSRLDPCNDWIEKAKDKETKIRASAVKTFIGEVIMTINNAPTVNDCPNCEYKLEADYIRSSSSYKELMELRKFKETNTRPQGEWGDVFHHQGYNYHKCSNCCFGIKLDDYDNFCPNCGADMRGEKK